MATIRTEIELTTNDKAIIEYITNNIGWALDNGLISGKIITETEVDDDA